MGGRKRLAGLAALALLMGGSPGVHAETKLELKRVATNLSQPLFVCAPRGDTNRIFMYVCDSAHGMVYKIVKAGSSQQSSTNSTGTATATR